MPVGTFDAHEENAIKRKTYLAIGRPLCGLKSKLVLDQFSKFMSRFKHHIFLSLNGISASWKVSHLDYCYMYVIVAQNALIVKMKNGIVLKETMSIRRKSVFFIKS